MSVTIAALLIVWMTNTVDEQIQHFLITEMSPNSVHQVGVNHYLH